MNMISRNTWALVGLVAASLGCEPSTPPPPAPAVLASKPAPATVAASQAPTAAPTLAPASAAPVVSTCRVQQDGAVTYQGPCDAQLDAPSGSTHLSPRGAQDIAGANPVTISPLPDGSAEVRGLTADGINARWGAAKKSATDPACWVGDDFEICASPLPGGTPSAPAP